MHVVHDGSPQATPLLLIHGSGDTGSSWLPMVPALAAHHHVIRVDLPGHGRSPAGRTFDVAGQALAVASVLDELGLAHVAVAGHSSGGYIATSLAEQRPGLVGSLALVCSGPRPSALLPKPAIIRALTSPPLGRLVWALRTDAMIRQGISSTAAHTVDVPKEAVEGLKGLDWRTFRRVLRANSAYIAQRGLPERVAGLGLPLMVIYGAADRRWNPSSFAEYTTARLEPLPGVGHVPMYEAPAEAAALLLDFAAEPTRGHRLV